MSTDHGMSMMMPPPPRTDAHAYPAAEIEEGTAQLTVGMAALPPASQPPATQDEFASPEIGDGSTLGRSPSLAKLAALLKSPSLEGLDSWETIHPDLLPEFTPRFTVTANPSLEPQLEGDARAME